MPVLELAEKEVRRRQLLPQNLSIKWTQYDDKCDASYATISAMDGYGIDCSHVLFGPACEFALGKCIARKCVNYPNDHVPSMCSVFFSSIFTIGNAVMFSFTDDNNDDSSIRFTLCHFLCIVIRIQMTFFVQNTHQYQYLVFLQYSFRSSITCHSTHTCRTWHQWRVESFQNRK